MAARGTMADLISRTRTLISDPGAAVFSDAQVQDALDAARSERRWVALRPLPTYTPSGVVYLDYYSDTGNWEADVVLQDLSFATVVASVSEYIVGHWQFASQPAGIGIRATGKTYDTYASAADLLEWQAAQVMLHFDFQGEGDRYSRSQKQAMVLDLAYKYRALAQPRSGRLVQSDASPQVDGGGVTYPSVGSGQETA